jgi:hypothetical protein
MVIDSALSSLSASTRLNELMMTLVKFFLCRRVMIEYLASLFVAFVLLRPGQECLLPFGSDDVFLYQLEKFDGQSVDVAIIACAKSVA